MNIPKYLKTILWVYRREKVHKLQALKAYRDCGNTTVYFPICAVAGAERSVSRSRYFIAKECGIFLNFLQVFRMCEIMLSPGDKTVLWCSDLCLMNMSEGLLHSFVLVL